MRKLFVLGVLAFAASTFAQDGPASMPAAPPEVQKTVDAFAGTWTFDGTLQARGMKEPAPVKLVLDCSRTALGAAVMCSGKGEATGLGPMEMGVLIGYDPEEKLVHFMAITSGGEYHDHKGNWKENTLQFEPLKYKALGKEVTEDLVFTLSDGKTMSFKSAFTYPDGSTELFEGKGTR